VTLSVKKENGIRCVVHAPGVLVFTVEYGDSQVKRESLLPWRRILGTNDGK
jgi:hypothetical protein